MQPTVGWVDDQAVIRALVARMVRLATGVDAETFEDHASLLEAMALGPFDVVVLQVQDDLALPEVIERIRHAWPATRVMVATGIGAGALGVDRSALDAYLAKPFSAADVQAVLGIAPLPAAA